MKSHGVCIPPKGLDPRHVLETMGEFGRQDANYKDGKTWSLVYYLGEEHTDFLKQAHNLYFSENGLNPMAFKSLKRFESEVIRMTANMLNAPAQAVGTMTSGGTESCLLAVKTYRDLARATRPWVRNPEMVVPESVHVAFEKAAHYFDVKPVHAPVGKDLRVNVKAAKKLISRNTILVVGSAPSYPHGAIDPIEELGALCQKKRLPLHVDACLGGFLLPWVEKLGYPLPLFDFRVPGVTSMSADIHKYGYAAKGASTIVYRDREFLKHQMYVYADWSGGVYASPALLGTRPGGSIAAAWATLNRMGESGYLEKAREIMEITERLIRGINAIDGLRVLGQPPMSVFAYASTDPNLSIYAVADRMEAKGWHIDRQQKPEALHNMVTPHHAGIVDCFLADLAEAVAYVRATPGLETKGNAAMYGMIAHIPLRGMIKKNVLKIMLDMYDPNAGDTDLEAASQSEDLATKAGMMFLKAKKALQDKGVWRR